MHQSNLRKSLVKKIGFKERGFFKMVNRFGRPNFNR